MSKATNKNPSHFWLGFFLREVLAGYQAAEIFIFSGLLRRDMDVPHESRSRK
jgi:hypothetical protein